MCKKWNSNILFKYIRKFGSNGVPCSFKLLNIVASIHFTCISLSITVCPWWFIYLTPVRFNSLPFLNDNANKVR